MTLNGPVPAPWHGWRSGGVKTGACLAAALVLTAGLPVPVGAAQEAAPAGATQPSPPQPAPGKFRFSFKDAPLDQVLDFFARRAGLPIIFEAPVPQGTLTFIGADDYTFDEALTILNLNLRLRGVQLRREEQFLYLGRLEDAMKTSTRVVGDALPEGVRPEEVVNIAIPLQNARAEDVARQIQPLIGSYGGVLAVPTQNLLIVVETAAQVRRLREIIGAIDSVRPVDTSYRLFPLRHARADAVLNALKSLMGERRQTIVIDKDNNRRTIDEQTVPGLNMTADPRTNSIVAVGPETRIRVVAEMVALLDVPESAATDTRVRSFTLASISADQATQRLNALFSRAPEPRPVIVPVPDLGRVTVVGPAALLDQAAQLLAEVDPGHAGVGSDEPSRTSAIIALRHALPQAVESLLTRMLTPRQAQAVRFAASPDGRGLVVTGPTPDVDAIRELIAGVDVPPRTDRQVRLVKVPTGDAAAILDQARTLDSRTEQAEKDPVSSGVESASRTIWIAGSPAALQRFEQILSQVQANLVADAGVRLIQGLRLRPSVLAERADRLVEPMLAPAGGGPWTRPVIEPVDSIGAMVVRAEPRHLQAIEDLIRRLDGDESANAQIRVIELQNARASEVEAFLKDWAESAQSLSPRGGPSPAFEVVEATNTLIIAAQPWQLPILEQLARGLDARRVGERPPLRLLTLRTTDATNVAAILRSRFDARPPEEKSARPVSIDVDASTNTLVVSAHAEALAEIEDVVSQLNEQQARDAAGREIRIFPLRVARAEELAQTLDQMFPEPPVPVDRQTGRPRPDLRPPREVVVRADRGTNSIIVDAPGARMAGFEQLVRSLDTRKVPEGVELRTYRVTRADVSAVANAVRTAAAAGALARGDAAAHAGPVTVEIEPVSRALVVTGPSAVFEGVEAIVEQLEGLAARPTTTLSIYPLQHARADRVLPLVQRLLLSRVRELQAQDGGLPAGDPAALVEVAADAASNTLLVSVPASAQSAAGEIIKGLDQPAASSATDVRVFRLKRGKAQDAAAALRVALAAIARPGEDTPSVAPEPASNSLIVTGTAAQLARAQALIDQLDNAVQPDGMGVRTLTLRHTRAEIIAPVLQQVLTRDDGLAGLPDWVRGQIVARRLESGQAPEVRVAADRRLNAVVVSGPQRLVDLAEEVVAQLDTAPGGGSPSGQALRVITLRNADAKELSASIEGVFAEGPSPEGPPPTVRVDSSSNSLIVRGTPEQLKTIEDLAQRLDAAAVTASRQLRTVPLDRSRVDAQLMARTLQRLLESRGGMRVEVISTEELLRRAAEEEPPRPRSEAHPALPGGVVYALAAAVMALQDQPATPLPTDVTIAVDPHTNSLLLLGSPQATERLAKLAAELQNQMPGEPAGVRLVTLPPAFDAQTVVQIVRPLIQQIGPLSPTNPGGFTGPVSLVPDPTGSAVIVLANDTDFSVVGPMIASITQLDAPSSLTVKVYRLSNLSAARAKQSVDDLVSAAPRGAQARRLRGLDVTLEGAPGQAPVQGRIDPALVRTVADATGGSLIVAAPAETVPLIDRFVALMDQSPVSDRLSIRRYELRHAGAADLSRTLQQLFDAQRQGPAAGEMPQARFVPDTRTNTLLVTASESQHAEVGRILQTADAAADLPGTELALITLRQASPATVRRIVQEVVVGKDPGRAERVRVSADDASNLVAVRAPKEMMEEVRAIIAQVDQAETSGLPVRSIRLERADASQVAQVVQRLFQERAQAAGRGPGRARATIVGDRRTGTLLVSASDEEFEQIASLARTFDAPGQVRDLQFKVIPLRHARASDISNTVQNIASQFQWERMWGNRPRGEGQADDTLLIEVNERTNSVVVFGQGELLATVERVIQSLDQPDAGPGQLAVRVVPFGKGDPQALKSAIERAMATPGWRSWRGPDPDAVSVEIDRRRRVLIMVGRRDRVEQAASYVGQLAAGDAPGDAFETIALQHARADRVAASLTQFFRERAAAQGVQPAFSVAGLPDGNVLLASGDAESLRLMKELVAQIDQPDLGQERRIDIYVLRNRQAPETAATLRAMFPATTRANEQVVVTPQPSTNSLVVSAPATLADQVKDLVAKLDAPPTADDARIETVALTTARAADVANALRAALPPTVKITITPVARSNTLLLTGSDEAIALAVEQIRKIDTEPVRSPVVFRRFTLEHALAEDVAWTVNQMLRSRPRQPGEPVPSVDWSRTENTLMASATADEIESIEQMVRELDVPAPSPRKIEFVRLRFAKAEAVAAALRMFYGPFASAAETPGARNVTIVPDPASNSLVIHAGADELRGVRSLLDTLDTEQYDTSRQLAVIPLAHADATSVARALNEGFRVPIESQIRQQQARQQARPGANAREPEPVPPMVLVEGEAPPSVSPEPQTNALIVFAGRRDLERIQAIVRQLDVPEFNRLAAVRILPLRAGKASALAATIRDLYARQPGGPGSARAGGPRSAVVIGDDTAGALIVRADDEQFAEIKALADAYQQQGELGRLTTHVVRLRRIPAARLRQTILTSFAPTAEQFGEKLAVEVERTTNTLVIASSPRLFEEIRKVIEELDGALPEPPADEAAGLSQGVIIVDVKHNTPQAIAQQLEALGLTRPSGADRPGVVSEPVTITPLTTRRALAILVNPGDAPAVRALVEALDADPAMKDQHVAVVPLRLADAEALAATLRQMISADTPGAQAGSSPARALAEQVRRLSLHRAGAGQAPLELDLTAPIRLLADRQSNSVIIGSTASNVAALREVASSLDALPLGEAVVVRIFPLANASAVRTKTVIDQVFAQGERLRRVPGTQRQGLPTTATGRALAGEIATSADERTNSLLVAGREEAVALVEVLIRDLDSDEVSHWVEPAMIPLRHADPAEIAERLNTVLVRGLATSPEAMGLQRQFGRLRVALAGADAKDPNARVQADLFAPVQSLSIVPVPESASLLVVGTPSNIEVVRELVRQLDVEAASAANRVRFFPLQRAAADRIAAMLRDLFAQRAQAGALRDEDRLVVAADTRTNTLVISTSARSFALVERLVEQLDSLQAHPSVGLHVIPVESASAAEIGPQVERLMRERIRATRGTGGVADPLDVFSVVVEPASNLLIVSASDENAAVVRELLAALTRDAERLAAGTVIELFMLEKSRPAEAVASLRQLYVDREVERRGPAALAVFANERLNAVVVRGSPRDIEAIRGLVGRIDGAAVSAVREVRRIELTSANALEVVNTLRDVLAGRPVVGAPGSARQATRLRFVRESLSKQIEGRTGAAPAEADIDAAIREQISLTPELRSNSVIVSAPADIVALVGQIIEDLDSTLSGIRQIETFRLVNADARQMAELLRGVFNLRQEGNLYVLVPAPEPGGAQPAPGAAGPETPAPGSGPLSVTAVPDERQQLSIAVDARTNSIVVSGSPRYLDRVRQLVTELDSIQATERASYVFHLRNAKAKEVETTLRDYFRLETELRRQTLGPGQIGALERQLEQEVTVVGDEKSNKIVFSTSPRYTEKVMDLLRELDAAPPQVMIQVLLAEVTIDESGQWGMDARFGPFGGDDYRVSTLGAGAGVGTSLGVPNLAVSSADFSLLIRALQAQGKLQVLSNPQVLANNNEKASIQVGENVAIVTGTERTPQGSLRADVTRQDVGIILDVTPTISTDGFVRMAIQPTISAVTARTTQISEDFSSPIISKREVSTVVTVKDGQSVLIGGLIQTQDEKRRTKVPILGDIPVLGLPFRSVQNTKSKTELLVILTPHVVPGGSLSSRAAVLTDAAVDRLSQPANVRSMLEQQRIPRPSGPVGPFQDPPPGQEPPGPDQPRQLGTTPPSPDASRR